MRHFEIHNVLPLIKQPASSGGGGGIYIPPVNNSNTTENKGKELITVRISDTSEIKEETNMINETPNSGSVVGTGNVVLEETGPLGKIIAFCILGAIIACAIIICYFVLKSKNKRFVTT